MFLSNGILCGIGDVSYSPELTMLRVTRLKKGLEVIIDSERKTSSSDEFGLGTYNGNSGLDRASWLSLLSQVIDCSDESVRKSLCKAALVVGVIVFVDMGDVSEEEEDW